MSTSSDIATVSSTTIPNGKAHAVAGAPVQNAHLVQFYEDDEVLIGAVARFLGDGFSAGDVLTVIATQEHTKAFQRRIEACGVDIGRASASGQLMFLDAHETLSQFMRGGQPDRRLFDATVGDLIAKRERHAGRGQMRAYGEMVDVLWKQGARTAAVRLEELWNDLQRRHSFTLLCAYAMGSFYKEPAALHSVCGTHTHVVGGASDGDSVNDHTATALPPQYAASLSREIAHREEVEGALRESLRDLRQKEDELRRSEEQLKDFVENATVGLHRVSPDGTILWANRADLDLLGYAAEEYVGRPISDFHVDADAVSDVLARLTRGETLHDYEARLRAKDGSIRHVLISSSAYFLDGAFVHSRCFTRDITDRRRAEEALRRNERQLQSVTDALPALVSYVDADCRYVFASAGYERWFGRPKEQIVGRRVEDVVGEAAYASIRPHVEAALAGRAVEYEAELSYDGAGQRCIEAKYVPQLADDGSVAGFVALVADISERKSLERYRQAAAARAERLVKITAAVADAVTADEVLEAVVDHMAAAVAASSAGLWLIDDDGRTVRLARSTGYRQSASQRFTALSLESSPPIPALDAIRRGEPIWIPSQEALLRDYPHLRSSVTEGRSYRISCLPLISHGRILGSLGITIEEAGETAPDERDFLLLVARYAGQAIERLRLLEAERRSRADADGAAARMGVLSRASRTFVEADLDLASRLDDIARELGEGLASCTGIALLDEEGRLRTSAVHHPIPEARETLMALAAAQPIRVGEGITGSVAQTGKGALVSDIDPSEVASRAAPAYRPFLERFPAYAMICAPLRVRGKVIGTVTATRTSGGETYTPEDLVLLEELADRAAPAIENSRLHRENSDARRRAEQLYHFARSVVSADRVEDVFEAALDAIEGALGTNRGAILTYDDKQVMRFRAWRHLSDEYRRAVEGHSPWAPDSVAPQPVLVPDVESDAALSSYSALFSREGIRSLAFIPLVTRGQLIGKFMVYYADRHDYSSSDVDLARAIANHLASVAARFAAISKLEDTIRYNELFAGVLAHDLRNPLGAIMTAAQVALMRQDGEADRVTRPISRILSSGQRMVRMIDQLLDVTRARVGGGIQLEPQETNLADLCNQSIAEIELAFPEAKVRREVVGNHKGFWDPDRLLQTISNLLGNAAQHGQADNGILVRLNGHHPDAVTLEVHNAGTIPEAMLPELFDPFRGTRHRRDYARGLGLGLFIVKEISRAHGGAVSVKSSPAEGTTFTITLPRYLPRDGARSSST
jgi:PAS domain S-box-containing protein